MKLSIHAILYLLCASVVSGQYAEAANNVIERQQEVNIVGFIKKCHAVVRDIWAGSIGTRDRAVFEDDLIDALVYVEVNSRSWHQLTLISDPFVKALYNKMKNFSYFVPNGEKEQPIDLLIKEGKVKYYISDSVDGLSIHDIWCAKLLCGIAAKIFWNCEKSSLSLEHITKIEERLDNASSKNDEKGVVLTAKNIKQTLLNNHLAQKKIDIGQIGEKDNVILSDIRGVNPKDYVQGDQGGKAFRSFDLTRKGYEAKASERAMTINYGSKDLTLEINSHEYVIPLPKTEEELQEIEKIAFEHTLTEAGKRLINDMLLAPETTEKQREKLDKILEMKLFDVEDRLDQALKAIVNHYKLNKLLGAIKPTYRDLLHSYDVTPQVESEMEAALRLNNRKQHN